MRSTRPGQVGAASGEGSTRPRGRVDKWGTRPLPGRGRMSLQGDLSTLEMADLLQSLELHRRTGVLRVESAGGERFLYFKDGRLTLIGAEDRPELMDVLVASGVLAAEDLERARRKRRRSKRSLGEVLVAMRLADADALEAFARARLLAEACELVAADAGAFTFTPGGIPRGTFDPEERRLGLELEVGPLLLEAAYRLDHWRMIRSRIPSDSAHYKLAASPSAVASRMPDTELAYALLERLDGTLSVREVMESFPHLRFEAYQRLAELCTAQLVRAAGPDDLAQTARDLAPVDPERAWELLVRGLEQQPQHAALLEVQAQLAEAIGETQTAAQARKLLAHIKLELGEREAALEELTRARDLDPTDTAVVERSMKLALEDGRWEDATADGVLLAELYRAPGLHNKAREVFEALAQIQPDDWDIARELALSTADCGDLAKAVAGLERFGKRLLGREAYARARSVYAEIAELDPGNENALQTMALIDQGTLAERRERRRRRVRRLTAVLAGLAFVTWLGFEGAARLAYSRAMGRISEEELIETGRYAEASRLLEDVREHFRYTTTAWLDVGPRVEDLRAKADAASSRGGAESALAD